MVKLSFTPPTVPTRHLGLVGKGIMYDSGGISLKPSDPMHLLMKMDMGGAAAALGAFTGLRDRNGVDAIIDIATLTGAALVSLGPATAPVFGNDAAIIDVVRDAAAATDEPVWQLPLEKKYRKQLDSEIADISNLGGPFAGATTAALFLEHFVNGTPWAHIDIAGTMQVEKDDSWRTAGATGFGARLLLQAAHAFGSSSS